MRVSDSFIYLILDLDYTHAKMPIPVKDLQYSDKYFDDEYEYRHVIIPRKYITSVPKDHLMTENEWRKLGIQQSPGWIHYIKHTPEPHVICFKRPLEKTKSALGDATNRP